MAALHRSQAISTSPSSAGRSATNTCSTSSISMRRAAPNEPNLDIIYLDAAGATTSRRIWPFVLGFFERVRVVAARCTLRDDVRHFRTDRIVTLETTGIRYPKRKAVLLKDWRAAHDADAYADKI